MPIANVERSGHILAGTTLAIVNKNSRPAAKKRRAERNVLELPRR
jgi:hypothetical protein